MSRDLWLLAISMFTWGAGEGMFLYFQPLYLQKLHASPLTIGAILGALGLSMAVAHIPIGYLADKIGRRPLLWTAWIVGVVAAWIMALANTLPVFVIGLLVYGLSAFVMAPLNSYITAARGKLSVGRAITYISAFYNGGAILGPILGGWIGEQNGLQRVYLISACVFILSFAFVLFVRPQPVESSQPGERQTGFRVSTRFAIYLITVFLAMFAVLLPQPLASNYLQNNRGLSIGQIGQLGSVAGVGIVVLYLVIGQFNARLGFLLGQAAVGLFSLVLWKGTGFPWFIVGYFLLGGDRVTRSLASAQTRELVHSSRMGLAYGITETVKSLAFILAPLLAGYLYTHDPTWMFSASAFLVVVSLIIGMSINPMRKPVSQEILTDS